MRSSVWRWGVFALTLGLSSPAGLAANAPQPVSPQPASPAPAAGQLADGLKADIYFGRFEHIDDLQRYIDAAPKPSQTKTLPQLNYAWGAGNVLDTTSSDLVGAKITGLLRFEETGTWRLKVTSNDGVRLTIGDVQLFEDPEIHGDSDSPPLPVEIKTAGLYPIEILYYEKKGTATLKLWWSPPNANAFEPIPAAAFSHLR